MADAAVSSDDTVCDVLIDKKEMSEFVVNSIVTLAELSFTGDPTTARRLVEHAVPCSTDAVSPRHDSHPTTSASARQGPTLLFGVPGIGKTRAVYSAIGMAQELGVASLALRVDCWSCHDCHELAAVFDAAHAAPSAIVVLEEVGVFWRRFAGCTRDGSCHGNWPTGTAPGSRPGCLVAELQHQLDRATQLGRMRVSVIATSQRPTRIFNGIAHTGSRSAIRRLFGSRVVHMDLPETGRRLRLFSHMFGPPVAWSAATHCHFTRATRACIFAVLLCGLRLAVGTVGTQRGEPNEGDSVVLPRLPVEIWLAILVELYPGKRLDDPTYNCARHALSDIDFRPIAESTADWTPADMKTVVTDAHMNPLRALSQATHFWIVPRKGRAPLSAPLWAPCTPDAPHATVKTWIDFKPDELDTTWTTVDDVRLAVSRWRPSASDEAIELRYFARQLAADGFDLN
jgi:hypothetical protein